MKSANFLKTPISKNIANGYFYWAKDLKDNAMFRVTNSKARIIW